MSRDMRAKRKWEAAHYHTASARIPLTEWALFSALCYKRGTNPNQVISTFVRSYIEDAKRKKVIQFAPPS